MTVTKRLMLMVATPDIELLHPYLLSLSSQVQPKMTFVNILSM